MDFDWKQLVRTLVPGAATIFGTPLLGGLVGSIVNEVLPPDSPAKAPGASQEVQEQAINAAMAQATPDQVVAFQKAVNDHIQALAANGIKLEQIDADDRASARNMRAQTRDWTVDVLALLVTSGFFGMLTFMLISDVPGANKDILNIMIGSLGTAWIAVVTFYFGSSRGSQNKDATIQAQALSK